MNIIIELMLLAILILAFITQFKAGLNNPIKKRVLLTNVILWFYIFIESILHSFIYT